jgi:AcrR family transcriptional regulator
LAGGADRASEKPADVQQRLLDSAETCYAQFGLTKTTMEDVARWAGLSRATVYRYFENRDDLLMGVVEREARRTAADIGLRIRSIRDPGKYIVEGILQSLAEIPKRPALSMLFLADAVGVTSRLLLTSERLLSIGLELLLPVIEPAREKGLLRDSVDVDTTIEWIFRILTSYLTVPSPLASSEEDMRDLLRRMLLPALLK